MAKYHEWQTDALDPAQDNANLDGDDTVAEAITPTVRVGNRTQIFKRAVSVPDSNAYQGKYGRDDDLARETKKKAMALKLDMEKAFLANQAAVAEAKPVVARLAGVPAWIKSNTSAGSGGVDPTGNGTNARTDGTPRAFSQTLFDGVMQQVWESSGTSTPIVFLQAQQMNIAAGFVGNNNQRSSVEAGDVSTRLDVYKTQWGSIRFQMSRHCRPSDVLIIDPEKWAIGVMRPYKSVDLAKTGDSTKRQLLTEVTLISGNEASSGGVFDCSYT